MTRVEAVGVLSKLAGYEKTMDLIQNHSVSVQDALHIAIKALEQEPVLDNIRAEINKPVIRDKYSQRQNDYCDGVEFMCNRIKEIINKYKAEGSEKE